MENPVLRAIEDGATVVTGGHRLARVFRQEYNALCQERGDAAWQAPRVLPWQGWMSTLWEDCQFEIDNPPVLLDPWQERVIWQSVVLESEESSELLQASGAAVTAQEAWALATEWRLDVSLVERTGTEDSRVFGRWARRFQARCGADGLLEGARLPDFLRGVMARLRLPARVVLAGFDELTPQQRDFVEACRAADCAIETAARESNSEVESTVRVSFTDPSREIEAAARSVR